jgi:Zn-finger nucleic acid-binding protein
MQCPVCNPSVLSPGELEPGLNASSCATCEGVWLAERDYRAWLTRRRAPETAGDAPAPVTIADVQHAKLCPGCRRIMLRYRVGHSAAVSIDICGGCSGIWCDRNEWRALQSRGLHDDLHLVATEPWQAEVRREETRTHLERLYRKRFGPEYDEIERVRRWLDAHPQRNALLAFLVDPDPLQVSR